MKCCVSTDVGTWTNRLNSEPDPDYSPNAGTGLLSPLSYALQAEFYYVGKIPRIGIGRSSLQRCVVFSFKMVLQLTAAATRGFTMVLFTASRWNNFVGGTCALPSAVLVKGCL